MQRFMGVEQVQSKRSKPDAAISFDLRVRNPFGKPHLTIAVATDKTRGAYAITKESVVCKEHVMLQGFSD